MFKLLENALASQKIEYRHFYSCHINQKLASEQKNSKAEEAAIAQTGEYVASLAKRPKSANGDILTEVFKTPALNWNFYRSM